MADKPLKYHRLIRILERYNVYEDKTRGKGSHRMLIGMVDGNVRRIATKCHTENDEKPKAVIRSIRRRFNLTEEDGVTDEEFYSK